MKTRIFGGGFAQFAVVAEMRDNRLDIFDCHVLHESQQIGTEIYHREWIWKTYRELPLVLEGGHFGHLGRGERSGRLGSKLVGLGRGERSGLPGSKLLGLVRSLHLIGVVGAGHCGSVGCRSVKRELEMCLVK